MNPRYLAYCEAQGNDPDTQLKIDRANFPAGCMAGFICWCAQNPNRLEPSRVKIQELEPDLGGEA